MYESCDFSDIGLGKNAKSMITSVIWNIGGVKWDQIRRAENSYINERGQQGGKICDIESEYNGGKSCTDTVNRTTEWYGKIGLIYPSDYMYASTNSNCRTSSIDSTNLYCKNDNWLYAGYSYWFLTPSPTDGYSTAPWYAYSKGNINNDAAARNFGIRPSLYLNSSIKIIGGNGSSSLPYILEI